ncbi:MAG: DNA-3-methyladenine glycosylase 2 family protein [Patescibacteria group bacterium]
MAEAKILEFFKQNDEIMFGLLSRLSALPSFAAIPKKKRLGRLMRTIVGQQLSVKAAATIWARVEKLVGKNISGTSFDDISDEQLREAGLSYQKIGYIRSIIKSLKDGDVSLDNLDEMSDEQATSELTKLKGIGVWSAEMFLMSALGRTDIFSTGDLGLVTAVDRHYGCDRKDIATIQQIAQTWAPYRSYASIALWRSLDNEPN